MPFRQLPLRPRQRWWETTYYGKHPATNELIWTIEATNADVAEYLCSAMPPSISREDCEMPKHGYKLSRREIARHRCIDCGTNVIRAGDYCMLRDEIWERQFGLKWDDNLCLACIEKRLGRRLCFSDLISFPCVQGLPMSATFMSRLSPYLMTSKGKRGRGTRTAQGRPLAARHRRRHQSRLEHRAHHRRQGQRHCRRQAVKPKE